MKDIGFTQTGGRLVEMNETEYNFFVQLNQAVENKSLPSYPLESRAMYFRESYDFSSTFEVIRSFYDARFRINRLQSLIDSIKESLSK